jgi:acyl-CoA thioesterase-2
MVDAERSELERQLALEPRGDGLHRGGTHPRGRHVFGGLIVAQALKAAHLSVAELWPHSVHASFLQAPDADGALDHAVERTRDGASFATRRVVVTQGGGAPVLVLTASFQAAEEGPEYQAPMAPGPLVAPEELPPGRYDGPAFDCRDLPVGEPGEDGARPGGAIGGAIAGRTGSGIGGAIGGAGPRHARRMWFRARGELPDDPALHLWGLAFASDHGPTRAVRQPHADHPGVEGRMSVSLDHSVWFHRPASLGDWLLSELVPVSTGAARGLAVGTIHTAGGVLVATVAQEALLRLPDGAS